jgi:phospholipid/cholesterol/gamma-HCH transport system ATP-binding protein
VNDSVPILSFEHATIAPDRAYDTAVWDVNLSLRAGDLALVRLEREHTHLPLADAASGLIEPVEGRVLFAGKLWSQMPAAHGPRERAKIGRVFDDGGWISSLGLDENILLAQRHHSGKPDRQILDEAAHLATMFGLPGLPRGAPIRAHPQDLRAAGCVRAFLGEPSLLILERPTEGVYSEIMPGLMVAIRSARERGAAVLWFTADSLVWNDSGVRATRRYVMSGSQLLLCER